LRKTETVAIYFLNGSRQSRKGPFAFCRLFFLALMSFFYCLPDVSENPEVIHLSFRTPPTLTITPPDLTDLTDLFDAAPLLCSSGRQQTFRRPSKTFSSDIADAFSGNLNVIIAVQSNGKYLFQNLQHISYQHEKCLFVRAGPGIDA
jgi:hypothetical protein